MKRTLRRLAAPGIIGLASLGACTSNHEGGPSTRNIDVSIIDGGVSGRLDHIERNNGSTPADGVSLTPDRIYFSSINNGYYSATLTGSGTSLQELVSPVCYPESVDNCQVTGISGEYLDLTVAQVGERALEPMARVSLQLTISFEEANEQCVALVDQPFNIYPGEMGIPAVQVIPTTEQHVNDPHCSEL